MAKIIDDFFHFLAASPTSWHAAKQAALRLATLDFSPLEEDEIWHLHPSGHYFTIRSGALLAFKLPEKRPTKMTILAAHTDSPGLKIKPQGHVSKCGFRVMSAEVYGAPLLSSWLNRDLGIAGKICVKDNERAIEEHLIHIDEMPLTVSQIAIHLKKDQAEKGVLVHKQDQLYALYGLETFSDLSLAKFLKQRFSFKELLSYDLRLVPLEGPRFLGQQHELLSSARIDNLTGCFAALAALGKAKTADDHLSIMVLWDHEEIGSGTKDGALSTFLSDCLSRIYDFYHFSNEEKICLKLKSLCLSLDMAHGLHPNYEGEKVFDPEHAPKVGSGLVIKSHAGGKYASDPLSEAKLVALMEKFGLPYQYYIPRGDLASGSTVGPLMAEKLGMPTLDVGLAQLSMHSIREIIACQDVEHLVEFLQLYLEHA